MQCDALRAVLRTLARGPSGPYGPSELLLVERNRQGQGRSWRLLCRYEVQLHMPHYALSPKWMNTCQYTEVVTWLG